MNARLRVRPLLAVPAAEAISAELRLKPDWPNGAGSTPRAQRSKSCRGIGALPSRMAWQNKLPGRVARARSAPDRRGRGGAPDGHLGEVAADNRTEQRQEFRHDRCSPG